jgi:hypothetical protein
MPRDEGEPVTPRSGDAPQRHCIETSCEFAINGSCAEGLALDLDECPNLEPGDEANTTPRALEHEAGVDGSDKLEVDSAPLLLHHGDTLEWDEATTLLTKRACHVVVVAGAAESGKTTLIAALNDCFQYGAIGRWSFAGSLTLHGFEQRCHTARVASGAARAHTERTSVGSPQLYHLQLRADALATREDLLICDLSGENYAQICASNAAAMAFAPMSRADHLTVLVDGQHLLDHRRQIALKGARDVLSALVDTNRILENASISIVVTKWDCIVTAEVNGGEPATTVFESVQAYMQPHLTRFKLEKRTKYLSTAARSAATDVPAGTGILELLETWMSARAWRASPITHPHTPHGRAEGWTAVGSRTTATPQERS